jgi:hypothetical protein
LFILSFAFWRSSKILFFLSSNAFFLLALSANFFCLFSSMSSALVLVLPSTDLAPSAGFDVPSSLSAATLDVLLLASSFACFASSLSSNVF